VNCLFLTVAMTTVLFAFFPYTSIRILKCILFIITLC
jgi:hypothetical protein